jgi:hypothetical protein
MPHIKNIIDTDCYIQFDTNQQLREFVERHNLYLGSSILYDDLYIRFFADGSEPEPQEYTDANVTVFHISTVLE